MLDERIKGLSLKVHEKNCLYKNLLAQSGLPEKTEKAKGVLEKLCADIYNNYIVDKKLAEFFPKVTRICKSDFQVRINGEGLGIGNQCGGFPNSISKYPGTLKEGVEYRTVADRINVCISKTAPGYENITIAEGNKVSKKIPPEMMEALRNALLDWCIANFEETNFLIEHRRYGAFIDNITTWGQLWRVKEEWYDILVDLLPPPELGKTKTEDTGILSPKERLERLRAALGNLGVSS